MKRVRTWSVWAVAVGMVLTWNAVARSQTPTPGVPTRGQHASDNVSGGAIAAYAPGNMVNTGVVRAQDAAAFARGGIEIVETTRPMSPRATFLVDAIKIVFEQLNSAILLFENVLRLREGLPPLIPEVVPLPPAEDVPSDGVDPGVVIVEDPDSGDVPPPQSKSGRSPTAYDRL